MKTTQKKLRALKTFAAKGLVLTLALLIAAPTPAFAASRIKDIVDFEGVRDNLLVGYGLVVGLNGTGDSLEDGHFTKQSLQAMLNRLGVRPTDAGPRLRQRCRRDGHCQPAAVCAPRFTGRCHGQLDGRL